MGKWDKVNATLQPLPDEFKQGGVEYYKKVHALAATIETREPSELIRIWKTLKAEEQRLDAEAKAARLKMRAHEALIEKIYDDQGITSMKLAEGGSLRIEPGPHAVIEDKEAFHEWCMEEGLQGSMNLLWQTTNSLVKDRLESGEPLPPGVKAFVKSKFVPGR